MTLWTHITAFLAPVDLEEATAADLTHSLMGGLVHTCSKPDMTQMDIQVFLFSIMSCRTYTLLIITMQL